MTSDILKRAAEAVEGVTPGPWFTHDGDELLICAPDGDDDPWHVANAVGLCGGPDGIIDASPANARFIAASRTLIPDMAAAIAERDAEIERLTARAEAAEALLAAATGMVSIVEGIDGVMNHGVWRDERGMRLKDTPEWVSLYNAHAAMKEGR